jgi:hypothetical protein
MTSTPRILWLSIAAIAVSAVSVLAVSLWAVSLHRQALKTVARDAAPSIVAAQTMRAALSDMDANVANELLGGTSPAEAQKAYEGRRKQLGDALVAASENVTYGDAERIPLQTLASGLSAYERQVQRARDFRTQNADAARAAYREAGSTMSGALLTAAEALDRANRAELDRSYQHLQSVSSASRAMLWLAGAVLLAVLLWVQTFLSKRMRRTLNPLLLTGTIVAAGFLLYVNSALSSAEHDLKVVKEDAFDSIDALSKTLAVAYDANADESRYLLDPSRADAYERDFMRKARQIAEAPPRVMDAQNLPPEFKGLLADELRNITFEGERGAAVESLRAWVAYMEIDGKIRALNRAGRTNEAIVLCVGNSPGESNWAFDRFENAVRKTLEINQRAFDAAAGSGFRALSGFEVVAPAITLSIVILAYFGLIARIREYSA